MKRTLFKSLTIKFIIICTLIISYNKVKAGLYREDPAYAYKSRGDYFRRKGPEYYAKAVREYENAIKKRNNYAECYYWIAWIFNVKGLQEQALMEINMAIKHKDALKYRSMFIDILYLKSEIFFKNNMNNEGKKILEEIIDYLRRFRRKIVDITEPVYRRKFGRAYFLLGAFYRRINKLTDSKIKYFFEAMRLGFRPDLCHYFLYEYYKSKGDQINSNVHLESLKRVLRQREKTIEALKEEISKLTWNKLWSLNTQNN